MVARVGRPKRSRRTLTTLLTLVLLSVSIITLDETGRASVLTSGVKSLATDVYSPLRSGVNGVLDPIGRFFAGAVDYGSLQRENQKLQAQIATLEHQQAITAADRRQYAELRRLEAVDKLPAVASLTQVVAEVTGQNFSDFATTISIDKGHADGVFVGYPVLGPGGLVGQVVASTRHTSTVRLLTDAQSQVGVTFGRQEEATLVGTGTSRPLEVRYISATTPVHPGQLLVTSGLQGAAFPPGIPVATVTSVHDVVGATDKQVTARPLADLHALSFVEVLEWSGSS